VDHGVDAIQCRLPLLGFGDVAGHHVMLGIGDQVDSTDLSTQSSEPLGQGATDETAGSGDEEPPVRQRGCRPIHVCAVLHQECLAV